MKSAYIMGTLLLLTACGGGGGSGTPGGVRAPITPDLTATSMQDSADNKSNIIAYAMDKIGNTPVAANAGGTSTIQSRNSAIRTNSATNNGFDFDNAIAQYKNMYDFATDNTDGKDDDDLKKAYLLSGGDASDYDNLSDDARKQFIKDNHEQVLRRFFDWDDENHKPKNWNHKTSNLADQKLFVTGNRGWTEEHLRITQTENGKITNIAMFDDWENQEIKFERKSNNKFLSGTYEYALKCGQFCQLTFKTNNPNESIENIKAAFAEKLEEEAQYKPEINKTEIQKLINQITSVSLFTPMSATELEAIYDKDGTGLYYTPSEKSVSVDAYGATVGLRHSDFGRLIGKQYLATDKNNAEDLRYVFAGGYDVKNIDKKSMTGTMEFNGKAVGFVMHHTEDENGVATDNYLDIASNNATLVFDNGKETLTANFSNWYDIKYATEGDNVTVKLSNGDKIKNDMYKFNNSEFSGINGEMFDGISATEGWANKTQINVATEYYGDGTTPSEAIGRASLLEQEYDQESAATVERFFSAGFGVVKK